MKKKSLSSFFIVAVAGSFVVLPALQRRGGVQHLTTNATIVGGRIHPSLFDLMDVSTTTRTPIATPTVVERDVFFRQGGDQLNGGRRGTVDLQPVT